MCFDSTVVFSLFCITPICFVGRLLLEQVSDVIVPGVPEVSMINQIHASYIDMTAAKDESEKTSTCLE